jgi:hypothetical protein
MIVESWFCRGTYFTYKMNFSSMTSQKRRTDKDHQSVLPSTVAGFKRSHVYILDSLLTPYDFVPTDVKPCGLFQGNELVYYRSDIVRLRSKQSWNTKFSKCITEHQKPTRIIQKDVGGISRTIELFAESQTEPLPNLVASAESGIPTNEYGNVEIGRIPANASLVTVPPDMMSLAVRTCRSMKGLVWCKCQTGWKRKLPVFGGVVVLEKDFDKVTESIQTALNEHFGQEEDEKRKATLALWRVLLRRIGAEWYVRSVVEK